MCHYCRRYVISLHSHHQHSDTCRSLWRAFVCFRHRPSSASLFNQPLTSSFTSSSLLKRLPLKISFSVGNNWKITWDQVRTICWIREHWPAQALRADGLYFLDDLSIYCNLIKYLFLGRVYKRVWYLLFKCFSTYLTTY